MRNAETQNEGVDIGAVYRDANGLREEINELPRLKFRNRLASNAIDKSKAEAGF
jgi:hypothetical protein